MTAKTVSNVKHRIAEVIDFATRTYHDNNTDCAFLSYRCVGGGCRYYCTHSAHEELALNVRNTMYVACTETSSREKDRVIYTFFFVYVEVRNTNNILRRFFALGPIKSMKNYQLGQTRLVEES